MKQLKFLSLLTFLALSLVFAACSDDDDYSSSDLEGTWLTIQSEGYNLYTINGKEEDKDEWNEKYPDDVDLDSDVGLYIQLKDDGTAYVGYDQNKMIYNGEWSVRKDKLVLKYIDPDPEESFTQEWNILKNTSTELVIDLKMSDTEKEDDNTYYYELYQKTTYKKVN